MDALKQNIAELSTKEQDELMLFILESRAGSKKKAAKKEKVSDPDAPKREMSEGQKAWTDDIKKVQLVVNRDAPADTTFKYKQAMTVASAIRKAELTADDKTIMTFYMKFKSEGASASESETTAVKKVKKTKVVKDE